MKNWMNVFTALAIVSIVSWGCARTETGPVVITTSGDEDHGDGDGHDHDGDDHDDAGHDHDGHDHGETVAVALFYCGDCGQGVAEDADHKCDPDGQACSKCVFQKGSALCCKIEGDFAGKALCASCGQIKGSDVCCAKDATVGEKCNLHAGSPLCCKHVGEDHSEAPAAPEATVTEATVTEATTPEATTPATDEATPAPAPVDAP